ncbi:MAG: threonine--tRNA ligase [Candidatus Micrarchaeota archaeon]|nr:threonine--tRNA ligase [Candidatus Micrarchaeota archaeon]
MKILELDVDNISYEMIKPESSVYEPSDKLRESVDDALALLISVERGDDQAVADQAMDDARRFLAQLKRTRVVIYPFAHLSTELAPPKEAMALVDYMYRKMAEGYETKKAPFGWNKALTLRIKGHPMAERSKRYSAAAQQQTQPKEAQIAPKAKPLDRSIVTKSDFAGLPETDHRTIGERLNLFSFQEVSPGMVYWHNNGYIIFNELLKLMREKYQEYGYEEISTPTIANLALWDVSGHLEHYVKEMFTFNADSEQLGLKAMNCPSGILVYKSRKWSYRDLPVRLAEFGTIYRNEISGALTGLFRVREITQDDAHIFAREDQIEEEVTKVLSLMDAVYKRFGFEYRLRLSTMPDDHMGSPELWDRATEGLRRALEANKLAYEINEKDGAFYGPKIDISIRDSMGREWQCATIQLDYQMPHRFGLEYTGEDGKQHMPVVIHKAVYGSIERFIGVMIEHYQGKFPTWLAPVQARVISISETANEFSEKAYKELKSNGVRAELDNSDKTLEYKIRDAQMMKVPYMLIIGKKEVEANTVAVRTRSGGQKFGVKLEDFVEKIRTEIETRVESPN